MQRYLRLLSYEDACKVIDFINKDQRDYANITPGGVSMQVIDENWDKVEGFIKSLGVRYEIGTEAPYKVEQQIVKELKELGVIEKTLKDTIEVFYDEKKEIVSVSAVIDGVQHCTGDVRKSCLGENFEAVFSNSTCDKLSLEMLETNRELVDSNVFSVKTDFEVQDLGQEESTRYRYINLIPKL